MQDQRTCDWAGSGEKPMSTTITCDWCQKKIVGRLSMKVEATGHMPSGIVRQSHFFGDFHTATTDEGSSCFEEFYDTVWGVLEARPSSDLDAIATASPKKVAALRRKHRKD